MQITNIKTQLRHVNKPRKPQLSWKPIFSTEWHKYKMIQLNVETFFNKEKNRLELKRKRLITYAANNTCTKRC